MVWPFLVEARSEFGAHPWAEPEGSRQRDDEVLFVNSFDEALNFTLELGHVGRDSLVEGHPCPSSSKLLRA